MRVLVTGVKGQLGYEVCRELTVHGIRPITVIITAEAINPKGMNTRALLWSETVPITNLLIP